LSYPRSSPYRKGKGVRPLWVPYTPDEPHPGGGPGCANVRFCRPGAMGVIAKTLQILDEDTVHRRTPDWVREVVRKLAPEGDHESIARRAFQKATGETMRALGGLWEAFGISFPPSWPEEVLRAGSWVMAKVHEGEEGPELVVWAPGKTRAHLPLSPPVPGDFELAAYVGRTAVEAASGLLARRGRAFLRVQALEKVKEAARVVKALRPFFEAIDLADLEAALEALAGLKSGEARVEGPHALLRGRGVWVLRTGLVLGDLSSTKDFLTRGKAVLSYPHGVEVTLKGHFWWEGLLGLEELVIRWRDEVVRFRMASDQPDPQASPLDKDPVGKMVRKMVKGTPTRSALSPRMKALIGELAESEDPLEAPKDPGFFKRLHLRALSLS